jgi:hypothetical protein
MQLFEEITIEILRHKKSYDFKVNPDYKLSGKLNHADFQNVIKNNMIDRIRWFYKKGTTSYVLYDNERVQTVANYPGCDLTDTLKPGLFQLLLFVPKGNYLNSPHGYINCYDLGGDYINENSMSVDHGVVEGRHLDHGNAYLLNGQYAYPTHCWSKGCTVKEEKEQEFLNKQLRTVGIDKDNFYYVKGIIREVS